MKPIDRIDQLRRNLDKLAAVPLGFVDAPTAASRHAGFDNAAAVADAIGEARWLIAFMRTLIADGVEGTYEQAGRERDATRPHESEPAAPLAQQFFEGAAFVRDIVRDWLHTDPALWDGPDNPYAVDGDPKRGWKTLQAAPGVVVLEFEPVEGGHGEHP